jgi:hypothetical protein
MTSRHVGRGEMWGSCETAGVHLASFTVGLVPRHLSWPQSRVFSLWINCSPQMLHGGPVDPACKALEFGRVS